MATKKMGKKPVETRTGAAIVTKPNQFTRYSQSQGFVLPEGWSLHISSDSDATRPVNVYYYGHFSARFASCAQAADWATYADRWDRPEVE